MLIARLALKAREAVTLRWYFPGNAEPSIFLQNQILLKKLLLLWYRHGLLRPASINNLTAALYSTALHFMLFFFYLKHMDYQEGET